MAWKRWTRHVLVQPDLLVLDLVLPELDGFGVCEAVRRDSTLAHMPVIMLTGLTGEFTRFAGLESGANEYVKKPVSPGELVSKIEHWLDLEPGAFGKRGKRTDGLKPQTPAG